MSSTGPSSGMRPLAAAQGISLRITALQSVIVNGDAARLRQVVTNLLSNAVKFTPAGGLIETCLTRDGSFAVVEVCDTGEGISSGFLPYVFERRAQATARRLGGLGLGLAIVKHIVELHGGSVAAASEGEGKGATFTIRIHARRDRRYALVKSCLSSTLSIDPQREDEEASGGPARPAALVEARAVARRAIQATGVR